MTFDEFWRHLAGLASLPRIPAGECDRFEDLDLDSLAMLAILVEMEALGAPVPEDMVPALRVAGDLYHHYLNRVS